MTELLYRITTSSACFGIVVEAGYVTQAAPIAKLAGGEPWADVARRYRDVELVPPAGWEIREGAGGWRCIQPAKLWSTSVYQDDPEKGSGLPRAIEAAETLERKATARLEETERLCAALRKAFRDDKIMA